MTDSTTTTDGQIMQLGMLLTWIQNLDEGHLQLGQGHGRLLCIQNINERNVGHWLISEWLAKRLCLKTGEMVIEFLGLTIWGRTTSGQAIYIDSVIEDIYNKNWA